MANFEKFVQYFRDYTNDFSAIGIIALVVDILLVISLLIFISKVLKIKFKLKKLIIFLVIIALIYGITYFCNLNITFSILKVIAFWSIGILVILYSPEIKHAFEAGLHTNTNQGGYNTEEEKMIVIDKVCGAAKYLSERKIGALICIEQNDSLDELINKAIYIKGNITEELLTSLFYVGSATHDGAVIIRNNYIMCAGSWLPSTDRYDIPKTYGSRHRAAIGVSEKYDTVTVVVSEETGQISTTQNSVMKQANNIDELKKFLENNLIVKK